MQKITIITATKKREQKTMPQKNAHHSVPKKWCAKKLGTKACAKNKIKKNWARFRAQLKPAQKIDHSFTH